MKVFIYFFRWKMCLLTCSYCQSTSESIKFLRHFRVCKTWCTFLGTRKKSKPNKQCHWNRKKARSVHLIPKLQYKDHTDDFYNVLKKQNDLRVSCEYYLISMYKANDLHMHIYVYMIYIVLVMLKDWREQSVASMQVTWRRRLWIPSTHFCLWSLLLHLNSISPCAVFSPKYRSSVFSLSFLYGHAAVSSQTP